MNTSVLDAKVQEVTSHRLSTLCGREFWNVSLSWDADLPDMGLCMERTVLIWGPCVFFWLFSPIYFLLLKRKSAQPIPWTAVSVIKIAGSLFLMAMAAVELVWAIVLSSRGLSLPANEFLAPVILLLTYGYHAFLVQTGRRYGDKNSGYIYCFWTLMIFCGIPQVITTIKYTVYQDDSLHVLMVVTFLLQYAGAIVLFFVNCFTDRPPDSEYLEKSPNAFPENKASFISKLTFHWANGIVWRGYKKTLTQEDIWDLPTKVSTDYLQRKWDTAWEKETASALKKKKNEDSIGAPKLSVLKVLLRMFFWPSLVAILLCFLSEVMVFANPRLLSALISFTTDESEPAWHGYFYAILLMVISLLTTFVKNMFYYLDQTISTQVRSTIMSAVYRKALILSNSSRRESTLGEIVNLMAIDSQRVGDALLYFNLTCGVPLVMSIALSELWQLLGPSVLAGIGVLLLVIPLNSFVANRIKVLQTSQMEYKDKRIKLLTEIINGIKVLKLYAWESSFAKQVEAIRKDEVRVMRKSAYYQALSNFVFLGTPYLVALASFTTFILSSEENILDARKAFVAISLINIIRLPLVTLPTTIAQCIHGAVSLKRLGKFFASTDIDFSSICQDSEEDSAIAVHGGHFTWGAIKNEESWKLKDVNMTVGHGNLVAVVGTVGSGKSSLLSALLGEMQKEAGRVVVNGKVAYVSQQAWLQNATLRENITWGKAFNKDKYRRVIDVCALQPDLDMLPGGDMTEVGEKGLNLSGGQKQRISLARAAYSDAEILLFDDPLSAVDSHVGKHIFQNLIGPNGLLKGTTRVLVTHAIWVLPQMDEIFVLQDGSMVERGSYAELMSQGGNFSQFLLHHINKRSEGDDADIEEELYELSKDLGDKPEGKTLLRLLSIKSGKSEDGSSEVRKRRRLNSSTGSSRHQSECDNDVSSSTRNLRRSSSALDNNEKAREAVKENGQVLVQEEKSEQGRVKWKVYQFYVMTMGIIPALVPVVLFTIAQASQAGGNVWLSQFSVTSDVISNTTNSDEDFNRMEFLVGYGGFGIGQSLFFYLGSLVTWAGTLLAGRKIHNLLLENILHLPMSFFDTNPSGRIMNRMSKDVDVLDTLLPMLTCSAISNLSQVVTTLIVIAVATPFVTIVIVPMIVVYLFIQRVYISTARQIKRIESVAKSPIYSYFSESLQGVSIIRAFKKQTDFITECQKKIDFAAKAFVTNLATNRWLLVRLECLGNFLTFAASIFAVAGRGSIHPGIVGLSISYSLSVTAILNWLVRMTSEIEANIVSVERIQEYCEVEQEAPWTIESNKPSKSWPEDGCVTFNEYQARYRQGLDLVVKGISCKVEPGEKVGIVGRTGAGKSSLTLGLFRIIEAAGGSIDIDGINISKIGLHDLRGRLSIIPQDPVLFCGTLRLNLDPFSSYTDGEVWRALENAHLKDYVTAQTNKLQTIVDEGGSNLSVGQRQLVCLARALLRKSKILVLDEATAAVDLDTDELIQKTILVEFADCTILTIAHRLDNIMGSDRVMVLDKGKIAEFSSPADLMANRESIFYGMAKDAGLT